MPHSKHISASKRQTVSSLGDTLTYSLTSSFTKSDNFIFNYVLAPLS